MENIKNIELNIWNACNLKCKFCMSIYDQCLELIAPKSNIYNSIIKNKKNWFNSIGFLWWEPTISRFLPEYIKLAKLSWYKNISIVTNGLRLQNYEYFEKLLKNWLNLIKASIHSIDDTIESNITQVKNSYTKKEKFLINSIDLKKKYNFEIHIQVVVNKLNYKSMKQMAKRFIELWVDSQRYQFVWYYDDYPKDFLKEIFVSYEQVSKYLNELNNFSKTIKKKFLSLWDFPLCYLLKHKIIESWNSQIIWENLDKIDTIDDIRNKEKFNFKERKKGSLKYFPLKQCQWCKFMTNCFWFYKNYFKYTKLYWYKENWDFKIE